MALDWQWTAFADLRSADLYALLQLRSAVFVVEQNCVFQDLDGADAQAMHLLGFAAASKAGSLAQPPQLLAYARCFPAGLKFDEASIGRVLTAPAARGTGLGHALMERAIQAVQVQWGAQPIRIGAQAHLLNFYAAHGFVDQGLPYLEDGIAHLEMLRTP
ncbi:MAG: GNAT family N-acetyltransferase [Gammaproteobacteria bacterium]|nr:GNAT family N-acetyltransferase [Rhodoferax sp.]MBU3899681.1 GNAT family N-acetyltransferase [Gammaproteobacteria bacterium]MBA3058371.1 GNAT family N-acetyltransferase [Rhodoferax sp.]MBU3996247.1 GNAT family N-acetyltransferase [Gammaproteobacteria bacterium]MBU4018157.1 GNAT family N-acetyltransferase [Gammaproteobacteria bacterium]MBU4080152.1 GNAT family N-acetyltransferase [Gammaproteobacteria bacterium]